MTSWRRINACVRVSAIDSNPIVICVVQTSRALNLAIFNACYGLGKRRCGSASKRPLLGLSAETFRRWLFSVRSGFLANREDQQRQCVVHLDSFHNSIMIFPGVLTVSGYHQRRRNRTELEHNISGTWPRYRICATCSNAPQSDRCQPATYFCSS